MTHELDEKAWTAFVTELTKHIDYDDDAYKAAIRAYLSAAKSEPVAVKALIEDRIAWHKCSCPEPCDDYNVFPGGCAGRYQKDYRTLLAALASEPANG